MNNDNTSCAGCNIGFPLGTGMHNFSANCNFTDRSLTQSRTDILEKLLWKLIEQTDTKVAIVACQMPDGSYKVEGIGQVSELLAKTKAMFDND